MSTGRCVAFPWVRDVEAQELTPVPTRMDPHGSQPPAEVTVPPPAAPAVLKGSCDTSSIRRFLHKVW